MFGDELYAGVDNSITGVEIWRTSNGLNWLQINPDGFGDSSNMATLWSNATVAFQNSLYYGIYKNNGGEIWQLQRSLYLPMVKR